jgi:hypothetical protein
MQALPQTQVVRRIASIDRKAAAAVLAEHLAGMVTNFRTES